jgi:uncharacterized membrane protein
MATHRKLWIGLLILALLTPLGLLLPEWLGAGSAWGEWGADEIRQLVGYVPAQLERLSNLWHAPLPDYAAPSAENAGPSARSAWYVVSALVGAGVVAALALLLGTWLARKGEADEPDSGLADGSP